jgi:hypothetical protein
MDTTCAMAVSRRRLAILETASQRSFRLQPEGVEIITFRGERVFRRLGSSLTRVFRRGGHPKGGHYGVSEYLGDVKMSRLAAAA